MKKKLIVGEAYRVIKTKRHSDLIGQYVIYLGPQDVPHWGFFATMGETFFGLRLSAVK